MYSFTVSYIPVVSACYLPSGRTAKNSEINIINGSPPPSDHLLGKVMINIFPPLERNHPSNLGCSLHNCALQIQCCQVAEIPAKKLKRGRRKKKLAERICGRILADFIKKWQKRGRRKFSKEVPYF